MLGKLARHVLVPPLPRGLPAAVAHRRNPPQPMATNIVLENAVDDDAPVMKLRRETGVREP